ncbi:MULTISPECIES: helix-turn-helix domain-containing protein [unclassified Microbacterium]|uniref:winged helix-turn-helix transcriptional regulator n=1 Tax=unclassified Microbacterium TaxID=2609290 RepID=UPI002550A622|nr:MULTISPECIES: helix-turn-helix domain-containing protein [unclassified Microbacterium]WIM16317.1 helix-turn-helix domain-containing protein [Microbacterium sp. zg-B96]
MADAAPQTMLQICTEDDPLLFRSILDRVGDKWTLIIIGLLEQKTHRFTELLSAIPGISRRMLTLSLRSLERDGLVERTVYAQVPPRVEYRVTPLGLGLSEPVLALAGWVARHKGEIAAHRTTFDESACDD